MAFGVTLQAALGGRGRAGPAPRLIQAAGLLTVAAGLLRRDRMLLTPGSISWHNHAHDVISVVLYVDLVAVQVLLAARFGQEPGGLDPAWRRWRPWLLASGLATAALLALFAAGPTSRRGGHAAAGGGDHPAGGGGGHRGAAAQDSGAVRPAVTRG